MYETLKFSVCSIIHRVREANREADSYKVIEAERETDIERQTEGDI